MKKGISPEPAVRSRIRPRLLIGHKNPKRRLHMIGELDPKLRDILLETLPIEFSILDADDKVQAWNKHETRLFKPTFRSYISTR